MCNRRHVEASEGEHCVTGVNSEAEARERERAGNGSRVQTPFLRARENTAVRTLTPTSVV